MDLIEYLECLPTNLSPECRLMILIKSRTPNIKNHEIAKLMGVSERNVYRVKNEFDRMENKIRFDDKIEIDGSLVLESDVLKNKLDKIKAIINE